MDQNKNEEIQDLIDCAYKNIANAMEAKDGMTGIYCLLGSIAHSLVAIAELQRDVKMNHDEPR